MKFYTATLQSQTKYQQSAPVGLPKLDRETADAYEERTWIERGHWSSNGYGFIPPQAFKIGLTSAAKFMGMQIPGKGKSTYTKHFQSGIMISEPIALQHTRETVEKVRLFVPSDGVAGSGKRVWKIFPVFPEWHGDLQITVLDEIITGKVLAQTIEGMGKFIGIGAFRPQSGGDFGRFDLKRLVGPDGEVKLDMA